MITGGGAPASAEVISLSDERASIRRRMLQRSARDVAETAFAHAVEYDQDGAYPTADIAALHDSGLLTAVLPVRFGGAGLTGLSLSEVLRSIGSGSLPLGRLFEGHVNALELVLRYGNRQRIELIAEEARAGKLLGVWNTDDANGLRLIHRHGRSWLEGRKILASGAGHIQRPLVTATDENGRRLIVLPKLCAPDHADLSRWRPRACALPRQALSISLASKSRRSRSWATKETMSDSLGFQQAHGASPRCTLAAWRGYSISFASICRKPVADTIRTRRRVWGEPV